MRPKLFVFLVCGLVVSSATSALAEESVDCTFFEIRASTEDSAKLDDELKVLEKKLKRPPFSSWNAFTLLSKAERSLQMRKAQTLKLSNGQATVLYRDATEGKKKKRLALTVTMDDQEGKRVVDMKTSMEADDYIAVGRSIDNGKNGHVLALTCR
jgi:hypothetical protein